MFLLALGSCSFGTNLFGSKKLIQDKKIVSGKLENGLSYYLQENNDPKGRVFIRLVVKAGSLEEEDTEAGVAHFVEHMAFNGTKSFPKNEVVNYFESIGMSFGDQLNASTTFDNTEYDLEVPVDNPEALATAFKIAREWADGISFNSEDVINERGVILEEERSGRGAGERVWEKIKTAYYGDTKYIRPIIGTPESIGSMTKERLEAFYNKFYRAELMAVVVVGDLKTAESERLMKAEFESLPKKTGAMPVSRDTGSIPNLRAACAYDEELTDSSIELGVRIKNYTAKTESDLISKLKRSVEFSLINNRMAEAIRTNPSLGVSNIHALMSNLGGDDSANGISISFTGTEPLKALEFTKTELARIAAYGFSKAELERVKSTTISALEDTQKNGVSSDYITGSLINAFLNTSTTISLDDKIRLYNEMFAKFNPENAKSISSGLLNIDSGFITLSMPKQSTEISNTELTESYRIKTKTPEKLVAKEMAQGFMQDIPKPVKAIKESETKELGLIEMEYSNGIKVILKQTDFEEDEIYFTFDSLGGIETISNTLSDREFANMSMAASFIPDSGFSTINAEEYKNLLAGKNLSISTFIGQSRSGIQGYANKKDLETVFQIARRTMTDPIIDSGYYELVMKEVSEKLESSSKTPEGKLQLAIKETLYQNKERATLFSKPEVTKLITEKEMLTAFSSFFCPVKPSVLVLSGSFDLAKTRELCDTYFGSLTTAKVENATQVTTKPTLVSDTSNKIIKAGLENKASAVFVYKTPVSDVDDATVIGLDVLSASLDRTLREKIREDEGGTYGVSVYAITDADRKFSIINISFETDPAKVESLKKIVREEVAALKKNGVSTEVIAEIKLAAEKETLVAKETNNFWVSNLSDAAIRGLDLDILKSIESARKAHTTAFTKTLALRYLDEAMLSVFTVLPEQK